MDLYKYLAIHTYSKQIQALILNLNYIYRRAICLTTSIFDNLFRYMYICTIGICLRYTAVVQQKI